MGDLKRFAHVKMMAFSSYLCTSSSVSSKDCCNVGQAVDIFVNAIHQPSTIVLTKIRKPGRKRDHVKFYSMVVRATSELGWIYSTRGLDFEDAPISPSMMK
jgi:hypothetical protein